MTNGIQPPVAEVNPTTLEKHGHQRVDNYFWLNQRENPKTIDYLNAENDYTDKVMEPTKALQEKLFEEIKGRIKQTDTSVPYKLDDYVYYTRFEEGKEYPIYCRKKAVGDATEEVMIDANELAKDKGYLAVSGREISAEQNILAFAVDTVGRRIYTIYFKNLATGETLKDEIPNVTGNMAWANDNKTLFYTRQDETTLRWYRIYRHTLGSDPAKDEIVFEETDDTFNCFVFKTKSKKYVMIGTNQTLSSEYRYLDASNPNGAFSVLQVRERDHEYSADHFEGHFYIRTNLSAKNFRLMKTPVAKTTKENWQEVIPHRSDVLLTRFEIFKDYLVLGERKSGLTQIRVMPWNGKGEHYLQFEEPAYAANLSTNLDFDTKLVRYTYSSLTTPLSVYDYDMAKRERTLLKQEEVLGGYDQKSYQSERLYAKATDGTMVPISLVYRKGMKKDGSNPLLLYGYGSYGASIDAGFSSIRVSLLDRGFIFAITHIRGGQEMGRQWYEDGKLFKKKNTFTDFIDCAQHLVNENYTNPSRLFIQGGSAGGLLIGAVVNMRPDLFKGAIAQVPFVDVVTTMLDDTIPLTTSEYDEWGNPNDKPYYEYMLSYSPYDNVEAKSYPNLLVTTGLHDSQVQYWEPAKWIAKLRTMKKDNNVLLLKTNMEAGHGGASGRYKRYREIAFEYAFLLQLLGVTF
ncbi:MAG: S9 family peptidase [Ignavibacteriae bacterium]|nr:S9 family peptidase [Ignavibacteriota bacterium]